MSNVSKDRFTKDLYKAILTLQNEDECAAFFSDLCTDTELKVMSQRFVVAKMLSKNEKYNDIVKATGASTAIVSRVKRSLEQSNDDGYSVVFSRLDD